MKKITKNIKNERGVTLVALMAMLIIVFTILSVVLYNGRTSVKLEKLNNIYSDISTLEEKIQLYYITNNEVPISGEAKSFSENDINPNDVENEYYLIDESAIEDVDLNNDIDNYIVNAYSLTVYYKDGYEYDGISYHTIPRTFAKIDLTGEETKEYQITFHDDSGEYDRDTHTYTGTYELPVLDTYEVRNGWWGSTTYYFEGWIGEDGKYYRYAYQGNPREVTSVWTTRRQQVRVEFCDENGRRLGTQTYSLGTTYGSFPTYDEITNDSREFLGWVNENGDFITDDMAVTISDTKLYAKFGKAEEDTFVVTFNPLEGTVKTTSKKVTNGNKYGTLPEAVPNDDAYEFEGWYLDREFDTKITANSIVNLDGNTTVFAKYTKIKFKVTFDFNLPNGKEETEVKEYKNGDRYGELPTHGIVTVSGENGLVRYRFLGWSTTENGDKNVSQNDIVDLTEDITLYGVWQDLGSGGDGGGAGG